jgi:hypothetical protein
MAHRLSRYLALRSQRAKNGFSSHPITAYFEGRGRPPDVCLRDAVYLRHDVDRLPARAVTMAEAEAAMGVASSRYFRCNPRGRFPLRDAVIVGIVTDAGPGRLRRALRTTPQSSSHRKILDIPRPSPRPWPGSCRVGSEGECERASAYVPRGVRPCPRAARGTDPVPSPRPSSTDARPAVRQRPRNSAFSTTEAG